MRRIVLLPLVLAAQAFANQPQAPAPFPLRVETLASPAAAGSAQPQLSVSSRGVLLSWIETAGSQATLRFAERTATGWSPARTAASGTDWFVNWADVPSVVRLADGTLAAHWLQKSASSTYAYDVRMSHSRDDGKTWSPSVTPHDDGTQTEHGFASLFQMPGSGLGAVWLDGRNMKGGHAGAGGEHGSGDMSLRFAAFDRNWKRTGDAALDLRVCECCPTAVAVTSEGPIVAYRDRSATEVRDIVVSRMDKGKWTEPRAIAEEGWVFPACPVNGPSLSARGRNVSAAWFQAKDNKPKAFVAFSSDAGRTFGTPIRLDQDGTLGRVDIELLPDGSAAAGYIDLTGNRAEFRVKRVQPDGSTSAPVTIASLANSRSSGYPRMALHGNELVFAWIDRDGGSFVRTATARLSAPGRVDVVATPNGGIQPQAVIDPAGTIHLLYFKGEPGGGDLFYVRRKAGDADFSAPLRVNSEAGSAIATGSVRGGQIALGRNGWVHVGWNGSRALERDGVKLTPMWYARLSPGGRAFEPQRPIGKQTKHLDGGGSVAADRAGQVHVVWHAAGLEEGEPNRRIYVATSADDGGRFAPEKAFTVEGGACGCCGVETFVDARARLQVLYRAAGAMIHRDAMWMTISAQGASVPVRLQPWELPACPMTTFAMAAANDAIVAVWETDQQVYSATLDPDRRTFGAVTAMAGTAKRKHPSVAINAAGDRLIAWAEGTAWARGGSVAWALRNQRGEQTDSAASAGVVPVWGLVSAIARPNGTFVIFH
jgi:hypothetical protein